MMKIRFSSPLNSSSPFSYETLIWCLNKALSYLLCDFCFSHATKIALKGSILRNKVETGRKLSPNGTLNSCCQNEKWEKWQKSSWAAVIRSNAAWAEAPINVMLALAKQSFNTKATRLQINILVGEPKKKVKPLQVLAAVVLNIQWDSISALAQFYV